MSYNSEWLFGEIVLNRNDTEKFSWNGGFVRIGVPCTVATRLSKMMRQQHPNPQIVQSLVSIFLLFIFFYFFSSIFFSFIFKKKEELDTKWSRIEILGKACSQNQQTEGTERGLDFALIVVEGHNGQYVPED